MTAAEVKMRVLAEWRTWIGHQQPAVSHTTAEALTFFKEIESNKPELLSFDGAGKWQMVHGWLLNAVLSRQIRSRDPQLPIVSLRLRKIVTETVRSELALPLK